MNARTVALAGVALVAVVSLGIVACDGGDRGENGGIFGEPPPTITPTPTPCPPEGCPTPTTMPTATPSPAEISLNVKGGDCDSPEKPAECNVEAGSTFTLSVSVNSLPPPFAAAGTPLDDGYVGIQSLVFYDGLAYNPTASAADEIVWPDSALPVRAPQADVFTGDEGWVGHGDAAGLFEPFPVSTYVGNIVEISLTCSAEPQRSELLLVSFSRPLGFGSLALLGASFTLTDVATIVPAKTEERRNLDLDGDGELDPVMIDPDGDTVPEPFVDPETGEPVLIDYGIADTLEINCA